MLRSTLKRNLFPIALITLGCLIFLAIILYLFRSHLAMVAWVLLGLLMIGAGVLGIVASNPKNRHLAGDEPSRSSQAAPGSSPPPVPSPKYSAVGTREIKPGRQDTITVSRPLLVATGVLFVCLILVLLANLGTVLRSLLTIPQTQIVDCIEAPRYAEDGWQFVSVYVYRVEDDVSGYTDHTACVMERQQFVWARDERAPTDDASPDDALLDDASLDDASLDDASLDDAIDLPDLTPYLTPTQIDATQPAPTQPLPTATSVPVSSPLPTWTLPPSATPEPTATLLPPTPTPTPLPPTPTPTPIPRTDVDVCDAISNDAYLDIYVQWEGIILDTPVLEDEGLWFQVQWTNPDPDGVCEQAVFFVSYDSDERFFEEDVVLVTGTIIDVEYAYEGESGETEYAIVVRADNVEFLDES